VFSTSYTHGPNGTVHPKWPPDGEWKTFHPDGSSHPAGHNGFPPGHEPTTHHGAEPDDAKDRGRRPSIRDDGTIDFADQGSFRVKNDDGSYTLYLNGDKYPQSAHHVQDAQAAGHPTVLTIDNSVDHKTNADSRRHDSLDNFRDNYREQVGQRYENVTGEDLDEYPPARSKEGGKRYEGTPNEDYASVRSIDASDNRGSGSSWWNHGVKGLPDGIRVHVVPIFSASTT
jgi:hypothetical protein